jgi:hypothetical protein
VLDPIDVRARFGDAADLDAAYHHIVGKMQDTLTRLRSERRFPPLD